MRVLLDTHVLLWALLDDPRLSAPQIDAIQSGELYVSSASVWEVGIKRQIGKLTAPYDVFEVAVDAGCRPLPMSWQHADAAARLPLHHHDPFDRMLIAQAQLEGLTLLSADRRLRDYDIEVL